MPHHETRRHSTIYGIRHAYITDKLNKDNFLDYAIVRDSAYIYIKRWTHKIDFNWDTKKIDGYYVSIWKWKTNENNSSDFNNLNDALNHANHYHKTVGEYPPESEAPWVIHTLPFGGRK